MQRNGAGAGISLSTGSEMACTHQSDHHSVEEQESWVPDLVCGGFVVAQAGQPALGLVRVLANDSPDGAASQGVAPPSR